MMQLLKGEDLSEVWAPYLHRPQAAVCPVFRDSSLDPEQFGSGVLISIGEARFLFTAAHVLDQHDSVDILIPAKDGFTALSGLSSRTKLPDARSKLDDRYDIAFIRLDPDVVEALHDDLLFLESPDCDPVDKTTAKNPYSIVGYPSRRSQREGRAVSTEIFTLTGEGIDDKRIEALQCDRKNHLLVQFRKRRAIHYSTMRKFQMPFPEGVSGGGIFAWDKRLPQLSALRQPKLVAIVTEYHEQQNVFVGTRLHCFLSAIRHTDPTLPIRSVK